MVKTWSEEGEERGILKGQRDLLLMQLKYKFPDLSPAARQRITEWPVEKIEEVSLAILTAQSLRELGLEDRSRPTSVPRKSRILRFSGWPA